MKFDKATRTSPAKIQFDHIARASSLSFRTIQIQYLLMALAPRSIGSAPKQASRDLIIPLRPGRSGYGRSVKNRIDLTAINSADSVTNNKLDWAHCWRHLTVQFRDTEMLMIDLGKS